MTETSTTVHRIVVVHGTPGNDLVEVLQRAGLESVVSSDDVSTWAPTILSSHPVPPAATTAHTPGSDQ